MPTIERDPDQIDGPVSSGCEEGLSLLPAQRLMAAHVALVVVATVVYMTVPATRTPLWAVIGLAGAAALVTGVRLHRPAHRRPWWVPAAGHFPIDVLKIDKSFIDDLPRDARQVALVEGIVRIADTLGMEVIAEGIEDPEQRDLPAGMGCRFGPGYLFARPMTVEHNARTLVRPDGRPPAPRRAAGPVRPTARWSELEHLRRTSPMSDAALDDVRGRRIRSGDHWLIDFASCNYLGFDRDPEVISAVEPALRRWGTHPSWSRLLGSPRLTGNVPDLPAPAAVCRAHGATLYVDDAHGFGMIGERGPGEPCPYGARGNGVVRYRGESYDDIVPVGGFSKAYSSLLAFVALPTPLKNRLKTTAGPYLYSGPSPTASLATALAGLDVNDRRGDALRADPYRRTDRVLDHLAGLGADTLNRDGLPIVEVPLADPGDPEAVAAFLWREGICVTPAAYPLVPRDRVGFRIQITALNSDEDIDRPNAVLTRLAARVPLRSRSRSDQSVKR